MLSPWSPGGWFGRDQQSHVRSLAPNFPRLGTIYSKLDINTETGKRAIARYSLYVTDFHWWPEVNAGHGVPPGWTFGHYLTSLNPDLIAIIYQHAALFEDGGWTWRPGSTGFVVNDVAYHIDLRWLLTYAGSTLTAAITPSATSLQVADLSAFAVHDRVVISGVAGQADAEMVLVIAKSATTGAGTLTVTRALNDQRGKFPASQHARGDFVRTVAHAFGDPAAMVLNVTSTCPATDINPSLGSQTWNQFLGSYLAVKLSEPAFQDLKGVFLDNFLGRALELVDDVGRADIDNTNRATGVPDAMWADGMETLAAEVRARLPGGTLLVGNTGGDPTRYAKYLNGGMIEGVDPHGANALIEDVMPFYHSWMLNARSPAVFIIEGSATGDESAVATN
jgi:hypothetical protein